LSRYTELFERIESRSMELRLATELAQLRNGQGKRQNAKALLEPLYSWFADERDTPDLQRAAVLLSDLADEG
jgi:hypothetical protein